jgi:hypothetical protein
VSAVTYNQGDSYKNLFPGAGNANDMNRYSVRGQIEADLWQDTTLRVAAMRSEVCNTNGNDAKSAKSRAAAINRLGGA